MEMRQHSPVRLICVLLCLFLFAGCHNDAPQLPPADGLQWKRYTSDTFGFGLEIPTVFQVKEYDTDLFFTYNGRNALRVTLTTEADARKRGLWAISRPVAQVKVASQPAVEYIYDHYDGPVYDHIVAYVLPRQAKMLAISFYTDQNGLNSVQQHMLDSVQIK